jgi:hypothetical protein
MTPQEFPDRTPEALAPDGGENDPLYQAARRVEQDEQLMAEMAEWEGTVADGLGA